jgi:hypothetical protein
LGVRHDAFMADHFPFPFWNARGTSRDGLH